jgi:hypothetical protein
MCDLEQKTWRKSCNSHNLFMSMIGQAEGVSRRWANYPRWVGRGMVFALVLPRGNLKIENGFRRPSAGARCLAERHDSFAPHFKFGECGLVMDEDKVYRPQSCPVFECLLVTRLEIVPMYVHWHFKRTPKRPHFIQVDGLHNDIVPQFVHDRGASSPSLSNSAASITRFPENACGEFQGCGRCERIDAEEPADARHARGR